MNNKKAFSMKSRFRSFIFAFSGMKTFFMSEHNAWIHCIAAISAILLGFALHISHTEWCFIIAAIGMVVSAEIFNTAIERLTDMVSPEYNETAKKVKDISAAGVLAVSIAAFITGLIIFLPPLISLF